MNISGLVPHRATVGLAVATLARAAGDTTRPCAGAHAIAILTEWDMFKTLDFQKIYDAMQKPAFLFDGRNIIDHKKCSDIGFNVWAVGKSVVTPGFA